MSKKATIQTPPSKTYVHEVHHETRQHRLVILQGGRPDSSPWVDIRDIGVYKGVLFAEREFVGGVKGVFTVRSLPFEVLA